MAISWHQALEDAETPAEVVAVARRYVARLTVQDTASLPRACRGIVVREASDIDCWNVRLADAARALWGTSADGRALYALANFFLRASVRLSHLRETSLAAD